MKKGCSESWDVVVIGGGAAGCMAALAAAERGVSVLLLERNAKLGRKLYITGKGRCNVTNACPVQQCIANTPRNGRFLNGALNRFSPEDVMAFFEGLGVPLKIERGNRVFPVSDHAADVIDALLMALRRAGVGIIQSRASELILEDGRIAGARDERGAGYRCRAVILATGGISYPATGSTGDGYRLARSVGHTIQPLCGSLVPLEADGCQQCQGLSLRNVGLSVTDESGKVLFRDQGEVLFTHFGLSGPLVLSASVHMRAYETARYRVHIDLKPALDAETLDARLLREFSAQPNKSLSNVLERLEPKSLIPLLLAQSGLPGELKVNSVTKLQRRGLITAVKDLTFSIKGPRPVEEAIVTGGGITVTEVSPKDMSSKLCKGLFLAGEILDIDAYTGGFNLQIAWATGHLAGCGAAEYCCGE